MQHNLFHVYTVDGQILNVLGSLRGFGLAEFAHEFSLCSRLLYESQKPRLLYLGAIFYHIAKERGGDHSTLRPSMPGASVGSTTFRQKTESWWPGW